jgi:hypothetical protein
MLIFSYLFIYLKFKIKLLLEVMSNLNEIDEFDFNELVEEFELGLCNMMSARYRGFWVKHQ